MVRGARDTSVSERASVKRVPAGETSVSKRAPANRVPRGCVQRGREKGQECKGDGGKAGRKNMEIHTISGRTYDQDSSKVS